MKMPNLKVICCKQKHIYNPDGYNSVPILVFFFENQSRFSSYQFTDMRGCSSSVMKTLYGVVNKGLQRAIKVLSRKN